MKSDLAKRLGILENRLHSSRRYKSALVVYDPAIAHTLEDIKFDADTVILLPDNGRGRKDAKDGCITRYFMS